MNESWVYKYGAYIPWPHLVLTPYVTRIYSKPHIYLTDKSSQSYRHGVYFCCLASRRQNWAARLLDYTFFVIY